MTKKTMDLRKVFNKVFVVGKYQNIIYFCQIFFLFVNYKQKWVVVYNKLLRMVLKTYT